MKFLTYVLELAGKYGLETEVIYWAMKALKEDPRMSIEEALQMGLDEWVK